MTQITPRMTTIQLSELPTEETPVQTHRER
jgi:hypothetical protein